MSALDFKNLGNKAFGSGDYNSAIENFTKSIELDDNYVLFSNRSAAHASLKNWKEALDDANECIKRNPSWAKGYSRKGAALHGMSKLSEARETYREGLNVDPSNAALTEALADVTRELNQPKPSNPMASFFPPGFEGKLRANPETAPFMSDAQFVAKLHGFANNPDSFLPELMKQPNDPRLMTVMKALLGPLPGASDMSDDVQMDIPAPTRSVPAAAPKTSPTSTSTSTSNGEVEDEEEDSNDALFRPSAPTKSQPAPEPIPKAVEEPAEEEYVDEELEREIRERTPKINVDAAAAEAEKTLGNTFYKKRDFETAISHYQKAFELDCTNPVYKLNLSAVAFEQKQWEAAIQYCDEALEVSKTYSAKRLTFSQCSKLYLRKGNALVKLERYSEALEAFKRSLLEENTRAASDAIRNATAALKEQETKQYLDPVKSEEAKEKGNEMFKAGKWPEAIELYTEAIKRNPDNYKVYSNRAACYTKIMQWDKGLNDCEACLKIDPQFVKAYIRKAKIQHFLKQYPQAIDTYNAGLAIEPTNGELLEGLQMTRRAVYEANQSDDQDPQRMQESMRDPAVQAILADPQMNNILKELSENPNSESVQKYLRDPKIMAALDKLSAAGILRFG